MNKILNKIRYNMALNKVARLEHEAEFISPFFCGKTAYPIKKARNDAELEKAQAKLKELEARL